MIVVCACPTFVGVPSPTGAPHIGTAYIALFNYAFAKRPGEELYDLRTDPYQTKNLAADPAFADTRRDMSARLTKILTEANDPRVLGDGMTFDQPPYSSEPEPAKPRAKAAKKTPTR